MIKKQENIKDISCGRKDVDSKTDMRTLAAVITLIVLLMSVVVSVYSFTIFNPIKVRVDSNTVITNENRCKIVELEKKEEARIERDKWMKETLQEMSEQIKDIYERGRRGTN